MNDYDLVRNSDISNISGVPAFFFVRCKDNLREAGVYAKKEIIGSEVLLYSTDKSMIYDLSVVRGGRGVKLLWREDNHITLGSEIHYAEFDDDFFMSKHLILTSSECNGKNLLPIGVVFNDDCLLLSRIDVLSRKAIISVYDLDNFDLIMNEMHLDHVLHDNYFDDNQCILANTTLTLTSRNKCYFEFLTITGSIITYELVWDSEGQFLKVNELFISSYKNVGFHRALIDAENNQLLIVYSESGLEPYNNIYVAKQKIFGSNNLVSSRSDSIRVNQTSGNYLRPYIIKNNGKYFISWEGGAVHFIEMDKDLNIVKPEEKISAINSGNILAIAGYDVTVSYQDPNVASKDTGINIYYNTIENL
ncbi:MULTISPECIES: hypothetical protein [Serratia]|jgi:hypothetical protein|uniref:hypothetical protein n=1 Tax=Serratia TaxID=613 RepID=UPI00384D2B5B